MSNFELAKTLFLSGMNSFQRGDYLVAEDNFRESLRNLPDRVSTITNLAATLIKLNKLDEAKELCQSAIAIDNTSAEAWLNLGLIDKENSDFTAAVEKFKRAIDINPDYAEAYNNLGMSQKYLDYYDDADASFRRALSIDPNSASAHRNIGSMMILLGKIDEAEQWLTKAVELDPYDVNILTTAISHFPSIINGLSPQLLEGVYAGRESLPLNDRAKLGFAMGKVMEHAGQYDKAFSAYAEGNSLCAQTNPYSDAKADKFLDRLCGIYSSNLFEEYASIADSLAYVEDPRVPIFIVGMPRSGSTLIEQIISSHHETFGAGELPLISEIISEAESFMDLTDHKAALSSMRAVGQKYLDRVWELAPDVHYITDKMPGNYNNIGLIHLILPQAKIIHSMRDPMDTCFSCYAINFSEGQEFSYDLESLGRQYLRYRTAMEHWHSVLPPGRILDVRYENVVSDIEHEARRILEYLELPWDPDCLKFHKNRRAVKTASASQVRKPIYTSSMARWKHFEKHLSPLMKIVKPEN